MKLVLCRFASDKDATQGVLTIDGYFACMTLEDQYQDGPKIPSETRIPSGTYEIKLRREGRWHQRLMAHMRIKHIHRGMLELLDVPDFKYILIHPGNVDDDTAGCILIGQAPLPFLTNHRVDRSVYTYMEIYPSIARELNSGKDVTITIIDADLLNPNSDRIVACAGGV